VGRAWQRSVFLQHRGAVLHLGNVMLIHIDEVEGGTVRPLTWGSCSPNTCSCLHEREGNAGLPPGCSEGESSRKVPV
jgi:hypothetical protein